MCCCPVRSRTTIHHVHLVRTNSNHAKGPARVQVTRLFFILCARNSALKFICGLHPWSRISLAMNPVWIINMGLSIVFSGIFFTNCALNCLTLWYGRIENRIVGLGQWGKCNRPWSCYTRPCDAALLTEPRVVHHIFAMGNARNYDEHWWTGCWHWVGNCWHLLWISAESVGLRQMVGIHTYFGWICTCGFMPQEYQNTGCLSRSPTTAISLTRRPRTSRITLLGSNPGTNMFGKITQAVSETLFALWPKGSSHSLTLVCWPGDFSSSTVVDWISLWHVCWNSKASQPHKLQTDLRTHGCPFLFLRCRNVNGLPVRRWFILQKYNDGLSVVVWLENRLSRVWSVGFFVVFAHFLSVLVNINNNDKRVAPCGIQRQTNIFSIWYFGVSHGTWLKNCVGFVFKVNVWKT